VRRWFDFRGAAAITVAISWLLCAAAANAQAPVAPIIANGAYRHVSTVVSPMNDALILPMRSGVSAFGHARGHF